MPSTEPELPVLEDNGVDLKDDEKGGEDVIDTEDEDEDNKVGLRIHALNRN